MDEFKLCSDGEFMPVSFPCPPPYSGPYYYYPYENIPLPPADPGNTHDASPSTGGSPISSGTVAGVIIIASSIFVLLCFITLKFRRRFILSNIVRVASRNAGNSEHAGESYVNSGDMLVSIAGCGLEEKLVNLLPVCEYVGFIQEGKLGKERHECAVCLSLFEEKEIVRVLPKCKHTFHVQCIDKWFESHANCPLCRERITLQTIQLSFNTESGDDPEPLGPAFHQDLTLTIQNNSDFPHPHFNDQHVSTPQSRHVCVQNVHDQQDGRHACGLQDLNPHQTIFFAAASVTNIDNNHTTEPYQYQNADHPLSHATGAHLANDKKAAGFTCRVQGLCDQNILPKPVATTESMKYKHHENASNAGARGACAHYIDDSQPAGSGSGMQSLYDHPHLLDVNNGSLGAADDDRRTSRSQSEFDKIGVFLNPNSSKQAGVVDIDDHKTALTIAVAEESLLPISHDVEKTFHNSHNLLYISMISTPHPSSRPFNVLRKSLSTGSLDGVASHPFYGAKREMQ